MTPADRSAPAALEQLAIALGPQFSTTLVTETGHRPRLSVTSRDTRAVGDVYAGDNGWFCWPWAEPIATTSDPLAAAHRITATLRGSVPVGGQQ